MKTRIYGYCRISTMKQKIQRQIDNIKALYPDAVIITEDGVSGCTLDRPAWINLIKRVDKDIKAGRQVTLVFDEVSRMSRNATEGFELYQELFNKGVNLVFLKERHIDTDVFKQTLNNKVSMTGTDVDVILQGVNEYLMILAKKQIEIAFQQAQHEVDYLHKRTSEGVRKAQAEGKQVGRTTGSKVETKKAKEAKQIILKHSKDFGGSLGDTDVIKLAGISRNSYYKYKSMLKAQ